MFNSDDLNLLYGRNMKASYLDPLRSKIKKDFVHNHVHTSQNLNIRFIRQQVMCIIYKFGSVILFVKSSQLAKFMSSIANISHLISRQVFSSQEKINSVSHY